MFSEIRREKTVGSTLRSCLFNLDRDKTSCVSGIGLGLHLSQSLAKFLSGNVIVSSKLNEGTCASIVLHLPLSNSNKRISKFDEIIHEKESRSLDNMILNHSKQMMG